MNQNGKIYFISDVHLGAPALTNNAERERRFVAWLGAIKSDASRLYLMGDIFDFWFEYKKVAPRGFTRSLGKLAELSDAGVDIHYFTGNHDVWVFDYLPNEIGLTLHRKPLKVELSGKKFFLAHGDGLDPFDKWYRLLKKIFTCKILQWLFARLHPNFALWLGHSWSKKSRIAKETDSFPYKGDDREGLFQFALKILKEEHFDYLVFGHRHLLVERPIGTNSKYINLGDWIHSYAYGVFDGKNFELKQFNKVINSNETT